MGLLINLLTLPLAPVRGVAWIADKVGELAEDTYYDASRIRAEIGALAHALDHGLISEAEFDRAEDELLARLEQAERRPRRL